MGGAYDGGGAIGLDRATCRDVRLYYIYLLYIYRIKVFVMMKIVSGRDETWPS